MIRPRLREPRILKAGICYHGHKIEDKEKDLIHIVSKDGYQVFKCRKCQNNWHREHYDRTQDKDPASKEFVRRHKVTLDCGQELMFDIGGPPKIGDLHWCRYHQRYDRVASKERLALYESDKTSSTSPPPKEGLRERPQDPVDGGPRQED